eukprot:12460910-Ditylum_brightwellii.AAC.1
MKYKLNLVDKHVSCNNMQDTASSAADVEVMAKALEAKAKETFQTLILAESPSPTSGKTTESKDLETPIIWNSYTSLMVTPRPATDVEPLNKNGQMTNWSDSETMKEPQWP